MPAADLPRPIIQPSELASLTRSEPERVRVVDVRWVLGAPGRGREAYDADHIPGAIFLDLDRDLTTAEGPGRHPLPSPSVFRAHLEAAGIGSEHLVVAYDDVGGWVAARLWWMLDDLGHDHVALLDGGYPAWIAAGYPVTTEVPAHQASQLAIGDTWTNTIDRAGVLERLGEIVLLDARGGTRYRGETEPIDPMPGHIPTAVNAPTDGNLGRDGRLLDASSLARRFRALGAAGSGRPVVTSCGSGVSACLNSLAMRVAGLPDPILYPGSYSDWSRAGLPVAVGPEPGPVQSTLERMRTAR